MASFSFSRILPVLFSLTLPLISGRTCYHCKEKVQPLSGFILPGYEDLPDCAPKQNYTWNTKQCPAHQVCGVTHIRVCKDGYEHKENIRNCGESEDYFTQTCFYTRNYDENISKIPGVSETSTSRCGCKEDKCDPDENLQPLFFRRCAPPVPCYACVESVTGNRKDLDLNLPECGFEYPLTENECLGSCQTIHIKACNDGDPFQFRLRGCIDDDIFQRSDSPDCRNVGGEMAKKYPGLKNLKAQACPCRGAKCNGRSVPTELDLGEGSGCREEPPKKEHSCSRGAVLFGSAWIRVFGGLWMITKLPRPL